MKKLAGAVLLLVIAAIIIVIALLYNVLFPKAFWQSPKLEQNQIKWENQHITHYRMKLYLPDQDRMPLSIEMKDSQAISVVDADDRADDRTVLPDDIMYYHKDELTIPRLFSYVYQTIWKKPSSIRVNLWQRNTFARGLFNSTLASDLRLISRKTIGSLRHTYQRYFYSPTFGA